MYGIKEVVSKHISDVLGLQSKTLNAEFITSQCYLCVYQGLQPSGKIQSSLSDSVPPKEYMIWSEM